MIFCRSAEGGRAYNGTYSSHIERNFSKSKPEKTQVHTLARSNIWDTDFIYKGRQDCGTLKAFKTEG